jgi:hypothetical protein
LIYLIDQSAQVNLAFPANGSSDPTFGNVVEEQKFARGSPVGAMWAATMANPADIPAEMDATCLLKEFQVRTLNL